jgi:D-glycero-D-manno-heptose 1,7-bisphosphate phosphatase
MRPAVLLDRDGTIIEDRGYLDRLELIAPYAWSAEAIRLLTGAGFAVAIVTNQAGVARGYFDEAFVHRAHARLDELLRGEGAVVSGYYYCPHHPDAVVERYRLTCRCRKPGPGMAEAAARDLGLDLARSFVVGDKRLDIELADSVGATGVLVRTGYGREVETILRNAPDRDLIAVDTLLDAARWIVARASAAPVAPR